MTLTLIIEGSAIQDVPSLYAELNRVFMAGEDWSLGESLDALDDLLHGSFGALAGHEAATIVWRDLDASRRALGLEATRAWLQHKIARPDVFNSAAMQARLDALERGSGQTYFDIVEAIFRSHPRLQLIAA